jgi:hypothetical protein
MDSGRPARHPAALPVLGSYPQPCSAFANAHREAWMKLKIRSDDANTLEDQGWPQMGDWLARLRDDSRGEPPGDSDAGAGGADYPCSEAPAEPDVRAEAWAPAEAAASAPASAEADVRAGATERPVIGDQLRMPIMWCEMGSCISWYTDPDALGEADTRARAIGAGWRIDALGRLACPRCQQTDPCFWASCPVVPWDRYMAVARAARVAAVSGEGVADSAGGTSHDPGRTAPGSPLPAERSADGTTIPNAEATPAGRSIENPAAALIRAAWPWSAVRARQARGGQAATSPSQ